MALKTDREMFPACSLAKSSSEATGAACSACVCSELQTRAGVSVCSSRVLAMPFSLWFWVGFFSLRVKDCRLHTPSELILFIGLYECRE